MKNGLGLIIKGTSQIVNAKINVNLTIEAPEKNIWSYKSLELYEQLPNCGPKTFHNIAKVSVHC